MPVTPRTSRLFNHLRDLKTTKRRNSQKDVCRSPNTQNLERECLSELITGLNPVEELSLEESQILILSQLKC